MGRDEIDLRVDDYAGTAVAGRSAVLVEGSNLGAVFEGIARQGLRVLVEVSGSHFTGTVCGAGEDVVSVETLGGRVDIHVTASVPLRAEVAEGSADPCSEPETFGGSFSSCLQRWADGGTEVSVGVTSDLEPHFGTIESGDDYVCIVTRMGVRHYVTLGAIAFVTARTI